MQRHRKLEKKSPPSWWIRCAVIALACLQVIAPTWHICAEGATGAPSAQKVSMAQCACEAPQISSNPSNKNSFHLSNQPMQMDFCLARLLQNVLGNSQFQLVLDFNAVTVSTLAESPAAVPLIGALHTRNARGPPLHLL